MKKQIIEENKIMEEKNNTLSNFFKIVKPGSNINTKNTLVRQLPSLKQVREFNNEIRDTKRNYEEGIKNKTKCPFAKSAKIHYAPDKLYGFNRITFLQLSSKKSPLEIIFSPRKEYLDNYLKNERKNYPDGCVISFPQKPYGADIEHTATVLREFLIFLSKNDPCEKNCMEDENLINEKKWTFSYGGVDFFIVVFAPLYPDKHPRKTPDNKIYIQFQTQSSFDEKLKSNKKKLHEMVRTIFQKQGMPYIREENVPYYCYSVESLDCKGLIKWWEKQKWEDEENNYENYEENIEKDIQKNLINFEILENFGAKKRRRYVINPKNVLYQKDLSISQEEGNEILPLNEIHNLLQQEEENTLHISL